MRVNEQISEYEINTLHDKVGQADEFGLDEVFLREKIQVMAEKNQKLMQEIELNQTDKNMGDQV